MNDFRDYANCLIHHGIKGQQWGVRNGPPYPIEDKVLRKGTELESISRARTRFSDLEKPNTTMLLDYLKNNKRWLYTYNPNDEWDKKVYRGPFAKYTANRIGGAIPEVHRFTVNEDLKMPTKKERVDKFVELYSKNSKTFIKDLKQLQDTWKAYPDDELPPSTRELRDWTIPKKLENKNDIAKAYEIFNHAMEAAHYFKSTRAYCDAMVKEFDAMVDDNNQGIYNRAHDPVIIFKVDKLLKSDKLAQQLTVEEIVKNTNIVREELEKHGERIKL